LLSVVLTSLVLRVRLLGVGFCFSGLLSLDPSTKRIFGIAGLSPADRDLDEHFRFRAGSESSMAECFLEVRESSSPLVGETSSGGDDRTFAGGDDRTFAVRDDWTFTVGDK